MRSVENVECGKCGVWKMRSVYFANTYYHPSPVHIMRKNPVFDGRVHIDLSTYHSLDEDQREMLKGSGLIVNII